MKDVVGPICLVVHLVEMMQVELKIEMGHTTPAEEEEHVNMSSK